jgi:hypothetical protein
MAITIGEAVLWIRGKSDKLKGDLDASGQQVTGWANRIKGQLSESMNYAVGQIMSQGLQQLSAGIENMARETIDLGMTYARQVEDMARLSGASVEDASRIIQVADDMRLSYDEVSTALKMYAKTQAENGRGAKMSIETLAQLSDQYLKLAPGIDRTNFLLNTFGKSGVEMGKLMEQGGDGIRSMADAVDDSLVLDQEAIDQQRELEVAFDDLNDAVFGVKLQFAKLLAPYLTDFANWLADDGIPMLQQFVLWFAKLPAPVQGTVFAIGGLVVALTAFGPALMGIAGLIGIFTGGGGAAAGAAGAAGGGGLLSGLAGAFASLAGVVGGIVEGALTALAAALGTTLLAIGALAAAVLALVVVWQVFGEDAKKTFMMIAAIIGAVLKRAGYEIEQFFKKGATASANFLREIGQKLKDAANKFKEFGKNLVEGIWTGIKNAWEWLKTQISNNINSLLDWVKDKLGIHSPSSLFALEVGAPMAMGIGQGFDQAIQNQVMHTVTMGAGALAYGASRSAQISVGRVEYHGRLGKSELAYLDRRSEAISANTLLEALEGIR